MSCDRADTVLHAYFDNELDALGAAEFERHLAECSECANGLAELKSLRSSLNEAQLFEKTPAALRKNSRRLKANSLASSRGLEELPVSLRAE